MEYEGTKLTYKQLDERANQLANFLLLIGVQHESPIPVLLHRGTNLLISWLAVLKAGAAIMPMDPAFPSERIKLMVGDGESTILITESLCQPKTSFFDGHTSKLICIFWNMDSYRVISCD